MKSKIMKFFSDLGRSLMMPVAALAACGIILGITSALLKTQVQDAVPFLTASVPLFIITTLNKHLIRYRALYLPFCRFCLLFL